MVGVCDCATGVQGQRIILWNWFSPSTMGVPRDQTLTSRLYGKHLFSDKPATFLASRFFFFPKMGIGSRTRVPDLTGHTSWGWSCEIGLQDSEFLTQGNPQNTELRHQAKNHAITGHLWGVAGGVGGKEIT